MPEYGRTTLTNSANFLRAVMSKKVSLLRPRLEMIVF
jgi:hypothetical protein